MTLLQTKCISCFGLPGVALTSRTLFPQLCSDLNTCRYHKNMLRSITNGTPLVSSFSTLASAPLKNVHEKRTVHTQHTCSVIKHTQLPSSNFLKPARAESSLTTHFYTQNLQTIDRNEKFINSEDTTTSSSNVNSPSILLTSLKPLQTSSPIEKHMSHAKDYSNISRKKSKNQTLSTFYKREYTMSEPQAIE